MVAFLLPAVFLRARGPFSVSYIGNNTDGSNTSSYSFAGEAIGTANSGREVWGLINWVGVSAARSLSSADIGGVSAAIQTQTNITDGVGESLGSAIIYAAVPSGTTATFNLNFSGSITGVGIGKVAVYNRTVITSSSSTNQSVSGTNTVTRTPDVANQGAVLGCSCDSTTQTAGISAAWTGSTEQYESQIVGTGPEGFAFSGAVQTGLSSETGRTVSCAWSGDASSNGAAISVVTIA